MTPLSMISAAALIACGAALPAAAQTVVGASWSNFQEERWKTDEKSIKEQLAKSGATYRTVEVDEESVLGMIIAARLPSGVQPCDRLAVASPAGPGAGVGAGPH